MTRKVLIHRRSRTFGVGLAAEYARESTHENAAALERMDRVKP